MSTGEMMAYCECGRLLGKCADCLRKRCDALEDKCRDLTQNFDGAVESVYKLQARVDDLEAEVSDYELHQWRDRAKNAEGRISKTVEFIDSLTCDGHLMPTVTLPWVTFQTFRFVLTGELETDEVE